MPVTQILRNGLDSSQPGNHWLAEALRQKFIPPADADAFQKGFIQKVGKSPKDILSKPEQKEL